MTNRHRFHLDQNGHSISVLCEGPRRAVAVLVDGRTVATARPQRAARTVLAAQLPGDPPEPFSIHLGPPAGPDDGLLCSFVTDDGMSYLMPDVPLAPGGGSPPPRATG
ncbi:hypothetical protein ACFWUQ_05830 [Streptomyces sp. NPDC058662]|uniref:hypothetical protein n=1 Tax=Streptomyces sp. NPDC058662 TaxID=3346583 RepID=UPI003654D1B2